MAISFISEQTATATTLTLPTHATGDLLLMFAYRTAVTAPTVPSGWISIKTGTGDVNAFALAYRFATGTDTVGTWTSATQLICHVYRGVSTLNTASAWPNAKQSKDGTTSPASFTAMTMFQTDGTAWIAAFIGSKQGTSTATPTGLKNRSELKNSTTSMVDGYDTNGGVASQSFGTSALGTSTDWWTAQVELVAAVASPTNLVNSTLIEAGTTVGTLPWSPTIGNMLAVGFDYNSATGPTAPTDNQVGNTYSLAEEIEDTSGGNTVALYYCVVAASSGSFIITTTLPTAGDIVVAEYSGLSSSPLDATVGAENTGGTGTQPTLNITPGQANELVIFVEFDEGNSNTQSYAYTPFTTEYSDPNNSADERIVYADYLDSGTAQLTPTTSNHGGSWAMVAATFKPATVVTAHGSTLMGLGVG